MSRSILTMHPKLYTQMSLLCFFLVRLEYLIVLLLRHDPLECANIQFPGSYSYPSPRLKLCKYSIDMEALFFLP